MIQLNVNNVLLIVPSTEKVWKKDLKNKIGTAPLGIASLSSILKLHGYNVKIIDMLVEYDTPQSLGAAIEEFNPDIIGLSVSYTESILTAYKIARFIKGKPDFH